MAKIYSTYICQQCGYSSLKYLGRCPECGTWNSLVETLSENSSLTKRGKNLPKTSSKIINLKDVEKTEYIKLSTGIPEFDRVLGGGIVLGSVVLVAGDPGIGKSTLLSQLAINIKNTLYVAGEESPHQIKLRVDRIKPNADVLVLPETNVDLISQSIQKTKPTLAIIDSIQTLETEDLGSIAGSVGQVREASHRLQKVAKSTHTPIFLVGHVTKEGTIAGPKTLEHLVDVVLSLEGETTSGFRILRSMKNRFGSVDEVGIFEMEESGLIEVKNPSKIFLDQKINAPGSVIVSMLSGTRPILVEIQALVTKTFLPIPRRIGNGIDNNRLQLLVAVLSKRLNLPFFDQDIFVNVTGGIKVLETASDLGICMAIISSFKNKGVVQNSAFVGEVGLLGELRSVRMQSKRDQEAKKLGINLIFSPEKYKNLNDVLKAAFLTSG